MRLALLGSLLGLAVGAAAAPKLRLETAAVGPVYIAAGQNGTLHSIHASNLGDGTLNLSVTSNVDWMAPCIENEGELLVNIMFATSKLAPGAYTGVATVTDPNAIDAPQFITVTIIVGSGSTIPLSLDFYVAAGATASTHVNTNCTSTQIKNPSGGPQISISTPPEVIGTFSRSCSVLNSEISVSAPASTPAGDYSGSIAFSGSSFALDNHTMAVTVHVGSNPVASFSPVAVFFRMGQNDTVSTRLVNFTNTGPGTLTLSGATSSATWLTAAVQGSEAVLTANPANLAPGNYSATVTVTSNAANGVQSIAIVLTVLPPGPPVAYFQGAADNAIFQTSEPVAQGGIAALFGERFTDGAPTAASSLPLSPTLAGTSLFVNDQPAPVYYVSPSQVNFLVPFATPPGGALIRVDRNGQRGNSISFQVAPAAPRLLRLGVDDYGVAVLSDLTTFAIPANPSFKSRPAKAGVDTVILYALGLGQTNPPALDGQAAQGLDRVTGAVAVLGSSGSAQNVQPSYAGLTPGSVGLYQINVPIPAGAPKGDAVPVYLTMTPGVSSNIVNIAIQ